jgi:hypothetical protein
MFLKNSYNLTGRVCILNAGDNKFNSYYTIIFRRVTHWEFQNLTYHAPVKMCLLFHVIDMCLQSLISYMYIQLL